MGASRELYFWSRGKARGTQPIQKAQNDLLLASNVGFGVAADTPDAPSFDQLTEGVLRMVGPQ